MTYRTIVYFVWQLSIKCITVQDYVTCVYNGKTKNIWKMYVYATLNKNECQILILIFVLYFIFYVILNL